MKKLIMGLMAVFSIPLVAQDMSELVRLAPSDQEAAVALSEAAVRSADAYLLGVDPERVRLSGPRYGPEEARSSWARSTLPRPRSML